MMEIETVVAYGGWSLAGREIFWRDENFLYLDYGVGDVV